MKDPPDVVNVGHDARTPTRANRLLAPVQKPAAWPRGGSCSVGLHRAAPRCAARRRSVWARPNP